MLLSCFLQEIHKMFLTLNEQSLGTNPWPGVSNLPGNLGLSDQVGA